MFPVSELFDWRNFCRTPPPPHPLLPPHPHQMTSNQTEGTRLHVHAIESVSLDQNVRHVDGPSRRMCSRAIFGVKRYLNCQNCSFIATLRGQECHDCCGPIRRWAHEGVESALLHAKVSPPPQLAGALAIPAQQSEIGLFQAYQSEQKGRRRASTHQLLSAAAWLYMTENYSSK